MTVTAQTNLAELARTNEAATKEVLARFAIIHCTSCSVPDQTVEQAAQAGKVPTAAVLNALLAALQPGVK